MGVKCFMVEMLDDGTFHHPETGETWELYSDMPPGSMWFWKFITSEENHWHPYNGSEGKGCLCVILPNKNLWLIDAQASNCTDSADFDKGGHKCWVRHGTPPFVTVDKSGKTCAAGAGSIQSGSYHGFLKSGELT